MKKIAMFFVLAVLAIDAGYLLSLNHFSNAADEKTYSPQAVIANLEEAVAYAAQTGDYHCCINPPCTMCYLGSWIFEEGTCDCDGMIAKGETDKVCPECKKGIEQGLCSSTAAASATYCDIDEKNHD